MTGWFVVEVQGLKPFLIHPELTMIESFLNWGEFCHAGVIYNVKLIAVTNLSLA
jgi:hypothetical protein